MAVPAQRLARPRPRRVDYPTSDGEPMGETDLHRDQMFYIIEALKLYFADRPDVYVSGDNFLYWEEGNPKAVVSPDAYVAFGVPMRQRDCYMAWKEGGRLPDVVIEVTSKKTRREDTDKKFPLYEKVLRVPEYFLFDPTGDYLTPRLRGYRMRGGRYEPMTLQGDRLHSETLNLDLVIEGETLRLYDPATQRFLPTYQQEARRAEAEAQRAEAEAKARVEAEAELERLRSEIAAMKQERQP